MCARGPASVPAKPLFRTQKSPAGQPLSDPPAWSDPAPRSRKRTQHPDAPAPGVCPTDLLPTGPSSLSRQTSTKSNSRGRAASSSFSRASCRTAPELTSRTCRAIIERRRTAYSAEPGSALLVSANRWSTPGRFFLAHPDGSRIRGLRVWKSSRPKAAFRKVPYARCVTGNSWPNPGKTGRPAHNKADIFLCMLHGHGARDEL